MCSVVLNEGKRKEVTGGFFFFVTLAVQLAGSRKPTSINELLRAAEVFEKNSTSDRHYSLIRMLAFLPLTLGTSGKQSCS